MWQAWLNDRLIKQKQANLYRTRKHIDFSLISFCSNDYLGLSQHALIIKALQKQAEKNGIGSGASALVNGYSAVHAECETAFANFLQCESAIFFSCGYMANLGAITTLADRHTVIFSDRYNHASLQDACQLSRAKQIRYGHLDMNHLASQIQSIKREKILLCSDGVFSMTGYQARITDLIAFTEKYNALLMIDDAHGIGILGHSGRGAIEETGVNFNHISLINCPLGKAFGCYGAILAGKQLIIENILQFARTYRYTTALPSALASAALTSLEILQKETWRREQLRYLINIFKTRAQEQNLPLLPSVTAIQAINMQNIQDAESIQKTLLQKGYCIAIMRPPSVPNKAVYIRITLNCLHTEQQIIELVDNLGKLINAKS